MKSLIKNTYKPGDAIIVFARSKGNQVGKGKVIQADGHSLKVEMRHLKTCQIVSMKDVRPLATCAIKFPEPVVKSSREEYTYVMSSNTPIRLNPNGFTQSVNQMRRRLES